MKIILNGWKVDNFQSLAPDQSVEISNGLWSILGRDIDSGGSNGTGKSSLVRAIIVGLLGLKYCEVTSKELKNRNTEGKARIRLDLSVNEKKLYIDRTIGGKLQVTYDGESLEGTSDDLQLKILSILSLTEEQINYLTNKSQGSFGGFLLKNDKEKKDFLSSFFDLEKIESAADSVHLELTEAISKLEETNKELSIYKVKVDGVAPYIKDINLKIAEKTSPEYTANTVLFKTQMQELLSEKEATKNLILQAKKDPEKIRCSSPMYPAYLESLSKLNTADTENGKRIKELQKQLLELNLTLSSSRPVPSHLTESLSLIDQAVSNFYKTVNEKISLKTLKERQTKEVEHKTVEIESMKQDRCSLCGQPIEGHKFEEIKKAALEEHSHLLSLLNQTESRLEELSKLCTGNELPVITKTRDEIIGKIEEFKKSQDKESIKKEILEIQSKISNLQDLSDSVMREYKTLESSVFNYEREYVQTLTGRISQIERSLSNVSQIVEDREAELKSLRKSLETLEAQRAGFLEEVNKLEKIRDDQSENLSVLSKTSEILSRTGFLGYIFDSILEELNAELNENLKSIPVSSKFSLYFTSSKLVKSSKTMTKTISYKLFSGSEEVSFSSLSGGEQLSVILSVDEALDTILTRRLGVSLSWKVFDEQFFWVDDNSKEFILNFLRERSFDKAYMIIDHAGELNAAIDNRIVVVKNNGVATVEVCRL